MCVPTSIHGRTLSAKVVPGPDRRRQQILGDIDFEVRRAPWTRTDNARSLVYYRVFYRLLKDDICSEPRVARLSHSSSRPFPPFGVHDPLAKDIQVWAAGDGDMIPERSHDTYLICKHPLLLQDESAINNSRSCCVGLCKGRLKHKFRLSAELMGPHQAVEVILVRIFHAREL